MHSVSSVSDDKHLYQSGVHFHTHSLPVFTLLSHSVNKDNNRPEEHSTSSLYTIKTCSNWSGKRFFNAYALILLLVFVMRPVTPSECLSSKDKKIQNKKIIKNHLLEMALVFVHLQTSCSSPLNWHWFTHFLSPETQPVKQESDIYHEVERNFDNSFVLHAQVEKWTPCDYANKKYPIFQSRTFINRVEWGSIEETEEDYEWFYIICDDREEKDNAFFEKCQFPTKIQTETFLIFFVFLSKARLCPQGISSWAIKILSLFSVRIQLKC